MGRFRRSAPFLVIALILALPRAGGERRARPAQRPAGARSGRRAGAGAGRHRAPRGAAVRRHAARAVRPGLEARAGDPGARAGRLGHRRAALQRQPRRPPGHLRRLQGPALRRPRRARVRVLRHRAALPRQRAQARHHLAGRRRARHVRPRPPGADRDADRAADDVAARVAEPQPGARAAGRRARQPVDLPGLVSIYDVRKDCRHPVLQSTQAGRADRPRERLLARRQDVLRRRHRVQGDHRGRRDRPEEPARACGRATSPRTG